MAKKKAFTVIDLFCGCGGLSYGFEKAGFKVLLGIDFWEDALKTYQLNHKSARVILANLKSLDPRKIQSEHKLPSVNLIVGGPPCQGFSIAGKRIIDDERNRLYKSFVHFVEYFSPHGFVMENVPNILSIGNGIIRDTILSDFRKLGYTVVWKILNASDYGVPQNRRRAFFVGLKDAEFIFPEKKVIAPITTKEAISDLPDDSLPDGSSYPFEPTSIYQAMMRKKSGGVYNHLATVHTEQTKTIISMVPDGGNYKDLPLELQSTRKVNIAWTRLSSNRPSFTIDTGHNHHFHYLYNRVPTTRESARLQSFPDEFVFLCGKTSQLKQVGNAVPPILAQAVAETIKEYLI